MGDPDRGDPGRSSSSEDESVRWKAARRNGVGRVNDRRLATFEVGVIMRIVPVADEELPRLLPPPRTVDVPSSESSDKYADSLCWLKGDKNDSRGWTEAGGGVSIRSAGEEGGL